jgi:hypothetical protein
MTWKSVNDTIGNGSGIASAGGGIVTAVDSVKGGTLMGFLNENAAAIGLIFTALTFLVFLVSRAISVSIELAQHRARMKKIEAGEE